jgi:subtilisin family serine protease
LPLCGKESIIRRDVIASAGTRACLVLSVLLAGAPLTEQRVDDRRWGLDRIDGTRDGIYHYLATGAGVSIYIVGTGVRRDHDDFKADERGHSRVTYVGDFCTGTRRSGSTEVDPGDGWDGHETHVASYAAGTLSGVAKNARIYSLRTTWQTPEGAAANGGAHCANGSSVADAINWITVNGLRPAVVNYSGGRGGAAVQDAILRSIGAGFVFTLSGNTGGLVSGNWGDQVPTKALVVGGTSSDDRALNDSSSGASHYGPLLAVYAPAKGLAGAGKANHADYTIPEEQGPPYAGDSFAAPFVAGAAALYLEQHPAASPCEVRQAIIDSADNGTPHVVQRPSGEEAPDRLLHLPVVLTSKPVCR